MTEENKKNQEEKPQEAPPAESSETSGDGAEPELHQLRQTLEAKEKEAKDNYDRFVRQVAESENLKKRVAREKEEAIRFANEGLVRDLLPVVDNLERAVSHAQGGGNGKPLVEGVEMVLKGLSDVLTKHGVVQISAVGLPFDPAKHEAMAQIETSAQEPNTVVVEFHKGYLLRDRLLRPALVSVAKTPITKEKKNNGGEVENGQGDD
ncbi:MAG: nucleotide exchange factor GrpE [Deltaproteobacteria bacterium]|nr:nucleotide exchange factor GrpE [Deltaproteobacteria bacterium]